MIKLQLQITEANAWAATVAAQNPSQISTFIQIIQHENKITDFKKKVLAKKLDMTFKLESFSNYDLWWDEIYTQALAIKTKHILKNKKTVHSENFTLNKKWIWKIKNETLFDMLLASLKPSIQQIVKEQIDEDEKNAAELWIALEAEFWIHAADTWLELVEKFLS